MRIKNCQFAMVPMWVISHPEVKGRGMRLAVYVGLRALAFQRPDFEWDSTRAVSREVARIIGATEDGCRKHLNALVEIDAITIVDGVIDTPNDAAGSQEPTAGSQKPTAGSQKPNPAAHSIDALKEEKPIDAHRADEQVCPFDEFWKVYPHRVGKREARTAFTRAVRRSSIEAVMAGLHPRVAWWARSRTPMDKIPHPATWLNRDGWLDELEPVARAAAVSTAQANADLADRQRDEVERAIAAGDADLAWKLTRARASARVGGDWFEHVARGLDEGRSEAIIAAGHRRDGRRMTIDDIAEVKAIKRALWEACGVSPAVAELTP